MNQSNPRKLRIEITETETGTHTDFSSGGFNEYEVIGLLRYAEVEIMEMYRSATEDEESILEEWPKSLGEKEGDSDESDNEPS